MGNTAREKGPPVSSPRPDPRRRLQGTTKCRVTGVFGHALHGICTRLPSLSASSTRTAEAIFLREGPPSLPRGLLDRHCWCSCRFVGGTLGHGCQGRALMGAREGRDEGRGSGAAGNEERRVAGSGNHGCQRRGWSVHHLGS